MCCQGADVRLEIVGMDIKMAKRRCTENIDRYSIRTSKLEPTQGFLQRCHAPATPGNTDSPQPDAWESLSSEM